MSAKRKVQESPQEASLPAPSAALPWDLQRAPRIPVARPRLASLEAALPYLRQIDEADVHPLVNRFEQTREGIGGGGDRVGGHGEW